MIPWESTDQSTLLGHGGGARKPFVVLLYIYINYKVNICREQELLGIKTQKQPARVTKKTLSPNRSWYAT